MNLKTKMNKRKNNKLKSHEVEAFNKLIKQKRDNMQAQRELFQLAKQLMPNSWETLDYCEQMKIIEFIEDNREKVKIHLRNKGE